MLRGRVIPRPLSLLLHFAYQEAASCLFPAFIFAMLVLSKAVEIPGLPRYDFMLLACVGMQAAMVWWLRVESVDELKVITLFHVLGTTMEVFKVAMGSWAYPDFAYSKLLGVPLYSGFMYASVASYITQAWRRLELRLTHFPPSGLNVALAALIYLNFFSHHYTLDLRYALIGAVFVAYWRARVYFTVGGVSFWLPLKLGFALVGFFIWLAENIATYLGAWQYPDQATQWTLVHPGKFSSWFLLFIVSFLIVAQLKRVKAARQGERW